jgi:hypothetical protein
MNRRNFITTILGATALGTGASAQVDKATAPPSSPSRPEAKPLKVSTRVRVKSETYEAFLASCDRAGVSPGEVLSGLLGVPMMLNRYLPEDPELPRRPVEYKLVSVSMWQTDHETLLRRGTVADLVRVAMATG